MFLIDNEPIQHQDNYAGTRLKRGLFRSSNGTKVNADINGAANIARKCNSDFVINRYGIEAVSATPLKFNPWVVLNK